MSPDLSDRGPRRDDGMDEYQEVVDRARQGLPTPRRARAAYAVSLAGVVVVLAVLLASVRAR